MAKPRGNQVLSGTWGEVWLDGQMVFELKKIEAKTTAEREDVQIGQDVDTKMTKLKSEGTLTVSKVYTRFYSILEQWKKGKDPRSQIICKLADPDAVGQQAERYSIGNVWFNEVTIANWEKGAIVEEEVPFGFTASDLVNLDRIDII